MHPVSPRTTCRKCGRPAAATAFYCEACGQPLAPGGDAPPPKKANRRAPLTSVGSGALEVQRRISNARLPSAAPLAAGREPWVFLLIGLITAPIFAATPLLQSIGWHLGALVHEFGHTLSGWSMGSPSIPRILPGVRADTLIGDRVFILVLALFTLEGHLLIQSWKREWPKALSATIAGAMVLQLVFTFTELRMDFFLLAGHLGELAFAGICLFRCLTAVATHGRVERGLYATVGWYLFGSNLWLGGGLAISAKVRAWYAEGSPCGLRNDYSRIADAHGWRIESVGITMCFVTLAVIALSLFLARKA